MIEKMVAIDTNVVIFLCDAFEGQYTPQTDNDDFVRPERMAIFRTFLFYGSWLRVSPKVASQVKREIQNKIALVHLRKIPSRDLTGQDINGLAKSYNVHHSGFDDCLILAEAELSGCDYLLTFDKTFKRKLESKTKIKIEFPSVFWNDNAPHKGTKPTLFPTWDNPKIQQDWYLW